MIYFLPPIAMHMVPSQSKSLFTSYHMQLPRLPHFSNHSKHEKSKSEPKMIAPANMPSTRMTAAWTPEAKPRWLYGTHLNRSMKRIDQSIDHSIHPSVHQSIHEIFYIYNLIINRAMMLVNILIICKNYCEILIE